MSSSEALQTSSAQSKSPAPVDLLRLIVGSLLGCVVAAILFSTVFDRYMVLDAELANMPNDEQLAVYNAASYSFNLKKATAQFAALGLLVGVSMGIVSVRSVGSALLAGAFGAIFGAAGGYLSAACVAWFETFRDESPVVLGIPIDPLLQGIIIQVASWALVGAGVGFGLFVVRSGLKTAFTAMIGGALGGMAAGAGFIVVSSLLFANSNNIACIPASWIEALVWAVIGGLATAACIYASIQPKKQASSSEETSIASPA